MKNIRVLTVIALAMIAIAGCGDNLVPKSDAAKDVTAFSFRTGDNPGLSADVIATLGASSITANMPFGTDLSALKASFDTTGVTVTVGGVVQISGSTPQNFAAPVAYVITAADGTTHSYTSTVTVAPSTARSLTTFSFNAANNPALGADVAATIVGTTITATVPFGTAVTALKATFATTGTGVTVNASPQVSSTTANDFTSPVAYTVTAADHSTSIYTVTVRVAASLAKDLTSFSFLAATNSAALTADVIGTIIGTSIHATVPFGTNVTALRATFSTTGADVAVGATAQISGTTVNNFTAPVVFLVTAADGSTKAYTVTITIAPSTAKALTSFGFLSANNGASLTADVAATIVGASITAIVPFGTNVTALVASFATTGSAVRVGATVQTSGATANNFAAAVTYVVSAGDMSTSSYTVTIAVASNPAKDLTALSFRSVDNGAALSADVTATIVGLSITATMPFGTDRTALVATYATTGASVKVGATVQISGMSANNFVAPMTYTVTAADGTTKAYVVTIAIASNPAKDITGFGFRSVDNPALSANVTTTIAGTSINATVPFGTDVTALRATYATTGASVSVGGVVQISGATPHDYTTPVSFTVTAADGTTRVYVVTVTIAPSSAKAMTAFGFRSVNNGAVLAADVIATIVGTSVTVTVPFATDVTALVATFSSSGTSVLVGATPQLSNTTANDFTAPLTYTVTAADLTTTSYVVTITVAANPAKDLTGFVFFSSDNGAALSADVSATIVGTSITATVPFGTDRTALAAAFATTGASVKVGATVQVSGTSINNFSSPVSYTVTAADGTTKTYLVTVAVGASPAKDITAFSFLSVNNSAALSADVTATIVGSSITATVPFGTDVTALRPSFATTGAAVTVSTVAQLSGTTIHDFTSPVAYTVTAADSSTRIYTVTLTAAPNTAKAITAFSFLSVNNGAALAADVDATIVGTAITVVIPYGTNTSLFKATFATTGASVRVDATTQVSGTTLNDFYYPVTYTVVAADLSTASYTVTVTKAANPAKNLTAYAFLSVHNGANLSADVQSTSVGTAVSMVVPFGTDVTGLVATFATSGASVKVGAITQVSNVTANDFTSPVSYTITAADGTTKTYVVTVTIAASPAKAITAFGFLSLANSAVLSADVTATIVGTSITATVPYGTDVSALVATVATTGASISVGATPQITGGTANNFTAPVVYTVTAADATTASYTVTVSIAASPAKAITSFELLSAQNGSALAADVTATIIGTSITATVPFGTDVSALVATYATTGAGVEVGATAQVSGTSPNDFTGTVIYVVSAADSTTIQYSVTIAIAPSSAKAIPELAFLSVDNSATLSADVGATIIGTSITATVPFGTDVTDLVASFATTGASVKVGTTLQLSGTTANDFSTPVSYVVTAADASTQTFIVTITIAASPAKAITSFVFLSAENYPALAADVTGTITGGTITATVPFGTPVADLVAHFETTGTVVKIAAVTQVSSATHNDFTSPLGYTVTAGDLTTALYTVTVSIAPSSAKTIESFSFQSDDNLGVLSATVNGVVATDITLTVPFGTALTSLRASFATTAASVRIGSTTQVSSVTANDFSTTLVYTAIAADASTRTYNVIVTVAPNPAKDITAFKFEASVNEPANLNFDVTGDINGTDITVFVPFVVNVEDLRATFSTTGQIVYVGTTAQVSTVTVNDFTHALTYTVFDANGMTKAYTVTVIRECGAFLPGGC